MTRIVQRVQSLRGKRASAAPARRQVTRSLRTDGSNGKCRRRPLLTRQTDGFTTTYSERERWNY